jgi:hypothetical protein
LFTRSLTLYQLLNIAYKKIINGHTCQKNFKCHHFVYEFIMAVAVSHKDKLLNFKSWPKNIRFIDNKISKDTAKNGLAFLEVFEDLKIFAEEKNL